MHLLARVVICLLVFSGGDARRDLLDQAIASFNRHVHGEVTRRVLVTDPVSQNQDGVWMCGDGSETHASAERRGPTGAIQYAWKLDIDEPFIFHLEDDFIFERDVDLNEMRYVLQGNPQLAQMALRRQPVNEIEQAAGGVIEQWPDAYSDRTTGGRAWLEHTLFWTNNPCLYRRSLTVDGFPSPPGAEQALAERCRLNGQTFGYWGPRTDAPWVRHQGWHMGGAY